MLDVHRVFSIASRRGDRCVAVTGDNAYMGGMNLTFGPQRDESNTVAKWNPEPPSTEEVDTILAAVPRAYRASAQWAVPLLLETARGGGISNPRRIAYVLATAQHSSRFGAELVEALDPSSDSDAQRFRGRGFVRVCGRANYATWSVRLALPEQTIDGETVPYFIADPDAMAEPKFAAQVLVRGMRDGMFTGMALGSYVNDKKTDYFNARRVIEGTVDAREVAAIAVIYQAAIEGFAAEHHRAQMQQLASRRASVNARRDFVTEVRDAVRRLTTRGEVMACPIDVIEWNGEARQGKFVQLDEFTCALHIGRGVYIRLDIQRDLNGIVPPEGKNMALKRSGEVRPAFRSVETVFWR